MMYCPAPHTMLIPDDYVMLKDFSDVVIERVSGDRVYGYDFVGFRVFSLGDVVTLHYNLSEESVVNP